MCEDVIPKCKNCGRVIGEGKTFCTDDCLEDYQIYESRMAKYGEI